MSVLNDVIKILNSVLAPVGSGKALDDKSPLLGVIPEFDSMAVVAVITALEDRFGFAVDDDEIDARMFETVGTLVAFVEQKLQV